MSEYYSGDYQNNDHQYSEYEHDGWKTTPYEAYENMPKKKRSAWKAVVAVLLCVCIAFGAAAGGLYYGKSLAGRSRARIQTSAVQTAKDTAKAGTSEGARPVKSTGEIINLATTSNSVVVTDVTNVVEKAMPSIVSVFNNFTATYNYWGMLYSQEQTATGSGIIIADNDTELLIVTNNHVVSGEESLEVQFIDGTTAEAFIKGTDRANDLAVITVSKDSLSDETIDAIAVAEIGDSDTLKVGEPAIAIGNALGYGQSVTVGVVSALNRQIASSNDNSGNTFIQTDAAINQGNSGGALLNINGEVIGINSNKIGGGTVEGMGYAIPISRAVPIIENLMGQGTKDSDIPEEEQGVLGVSGVSVTADVSAAYGMPVGVYVARTLEGGAAEQAGIKKGDIIVALNGSTIETMDDLKTQLSYYRAGEEVTVTIERPENGGEYEEAEVDLVLSDRSVLQNDQPASGGAGSKAGEAGQAEEGADEENRDKEPSSPFQFNRGE